MFIPMNRYTPHPFHQIYPILFIMIAGVITSSFPNGYTITGFVVSVIIALLVGIWIATAGVLEKYTEYWREVSRATDKLSNAPPDVRWNAMGKESPPQNITVGVNYTNEPGESTYYSFKNFNLPVTPEEMRIISDSILTGVKTFAEGDWTNTEIGQTKIRELKREMVRGDFLVKSNERNSRLGFTPTQKGWLLMYQYSSDWVKELDNISDQFKVMERSPYPTPSEQVDTP